MSRIFSEKQEAAIMEIATEEVTRALKKGRREWPRLWPRVPPPHRRDYNPEDPSIKPPPTPSPPPPVLPVGKVWSEEWHRFEHWPSPPPPVPPVGKASSVIPIVVMREPEEWPFQMISVTMGLAEDRLREIIREEIRKAQEEEADGKG